MYLRLAYKKAQLFCFYNYHQNMSSALQPSIRNFFHGVLRMMSLKFIAKIK